MRNLRILALIAFAAAAGFLAAQDSGEWYIGKTIKSVEFQGLKTVSHGDLDALVKPFVGKPFSDELFLDLQNKIFEADYFDSVEPTALGDKDSPSIVIRFTVVEKAVIDDIRFEGNSGLKKLDLLAVVTSKTGDMSNKMTIAADEDAIHKLYSEKGYPQATVKSEERKSEKGVVLAFIIEEGSQIIVKKIAITGNQAFSEKTLKAALPLKEQGLFQPGSYQEEKIVSSQDTLKSYYLDRGYIDASVSPAVIDRERDEKKKRDNATVTYSVTEGRQYTYTGINFEGNVIFSTEKLRALCVQRTGQVFNNSKYKADMDRVRNLYYENGYVFSQIESKEVRDDTTGNSISYLVQIVERDRAHISEIQVKGNTKTKDSVILREFPIEPGDIFSKSKIEQGYRNLLSLQYFSSIYPEVVPVSEQIVDIVLNVTEQSTAGFNFGMSYIPTTSTSTSKIPFGGFVKWNDSNFLGGGQNVAADTEFTWDTQSLTLSYTENWLANKRWQGGASLSFKREQKTVAQDILSPIFDSSQAVPDPYESYEEYKAANYTVPSEYMMTYDSWNLGAGVNTGYVFKFGLSDLGVKAGLNFTLENITYDDTKYRPYNEDIRDNHNQWLLSDSLTQYSYWNSLDVPYNPTKGVIATNKFTLSGFTPTIESQQYIREDAKIEAFLTLFSIPVLESWNFKMVLGAHSSYTGLYPKPGIDMKVKTGSYPSVDGMMVMRGWTELVDYDATGIWYNWLELRMPIVEQVLWLDLFVDAAVVQTEEGILQPISGGANVEAGNLFSANADNYAFSIGAMLRLTIQQLPIKIGLAKKFVISDGNLKAVHGDIFPTDTDPLSGFAFIISLSQALY